MITQITNNNYTTQEKLQILADAAKYDVACTSSGSSRRGKKGELGNAEACGICHSFAADGRCISLLKILMTNHCAYDCKYCMPCPYALDIPGILLHYNKCVNEGNVPKSAQDENYAKARRAFLVGYDRSVPKLRQANHCTGCEQCNPHCPQGIDIPKEMQRIDKFVEELKVNG